MSSISQIINPHIQDLGGFNARRSLPHKERTTVGGFIFFDHLGPAKFPPGKGVDVRPHPHINLATVTYLFEGILLHRDSLGVVQEIHPGAVNWMTAGKGIVHSERSPKSDRDRQTTLHAIQTWVALPEEYEEIDPWFRHHKCEDIPSWIENGVKVALIAGEIRGKTSPVQTLSPLIYLDLMFTSQAEFKLPADYSERAVYSVTPGIVIDGEPLEQHRLAILVAEREITISAPAEARCMVIGGEPIGKRYKWWNFVSSNPERIEQAKRDWQEGKFPQVPGETEFIPLPEEQAVVSYP